MNTHNALSSSTGLLLSIVLGAVCPGVLPWLVQDGQKTRATIFAQQIVDDTLVAHPEIEGLELATTPPGKTECITIASTDAKEIGEKCGKDEFTAIETNEPLVEKETENGKEVFDVTLPIHDSNGQRVGTVAMDFKPEPRQEQAKVIERAKQIAKELESRIITKERLFEPTSST